MTTPRVEEVITIGQAVFAASMAGHIVSAANLRHACRTHRLDARRFGTQWMIGRETLMAWLGDPAMHKTGRKVTK